MTDDELDRLAPALGGQPQHLVYRFRDQAAVGRVEPLQLRGHVLVERLGLAGQVGKAHPEGRGDVRQLLDGRGAEKSALDF